MNFYKYQSIDNLHKFNTNDLAEGQWVVTEKIHGANLAVYVGADEIKLAKRTSFLSDTEEQGKGFFKTFGVKQKYINHWKQLFEQLKAGGAVDYIIIFGELYGGFYPEIQSANETQKPIQKGVWYCPEYEWIGFDIAIVFRDFPDSVEFLDYTEALKQCRLAKVPFVEPLYIGPVIEAIRISQESSANQTAIPSMYAMPPIHDNIREGNVIKPDKPAFLKNGSKLVFKDKNQRFCETTHTFKYPLVTENTAGPLQDCLKYITNQRLCNVISKHGPFIAELPNRKQFVALFKEDIIADLKKDYADAGTPLENKDLGLVFQLVHSEANKLISDSYPRGITTRDERHYCQKRPIDPSEMQHTIELKNKD